MSNNNERLTFRSMEIIGIDHGFGQIKTRFNTFRSGVITMDTEPSVSGDILILDGKYHIIGEQHKTFIQNKTEDDDYYILTVAALAKELKSRQLREADVIIAAGLPLQWVTAGKKDFLDYLLRKERVEFSYMGKEYRVHICGAYIYPQGFAGIATRLHEFNGINILADIGNGTMNTMYIKNGRPGISECYTDKLGVEQCIIRMQNEFQSIGGTKAPYELMESYLWTGKSDLPDKYLDMMKRVAEEYAARIMGRLREYEYNPEIMKLHVMGGGICILKNFWDFEGAKVDFIDDIRATAKGYEVLALNDLRRGKDAGRSLKTA